VDTFLPLKFDIFLRLDDRAIQRILREIDGHEPELIDTILSNIIKQEKDEQLRVLKEIQKEAVLRLQDGTNPRMIYALLNSFTDIPLNEQPFPNLG
jgi:hypothetical protein